MKEIINWVVATPFGMTKFSTKEEAENYCMEQFGGTEIFHPAPMYATHPRSV